MKNENEEKKTTKEKTKADRLPLFQCTHSYDAYVCKYLPRRTDALSDHKKMFDHQPCFLMVVEVAMVT